MPGWLGKIGSLLGLGGAADAASFGAFLTPRPPTFARDQIRHDVWAMPYRGPLDLDPHGGETPHMRETYRALYQREGVVAAALDGKVEGIATADVTIEPFDRHDPASRDHAEFLNWSVDQADGGWDTITTDTLLPAFLDGWAALEITLQPARHPRFGWVWALRHCRSLDTRFLRLRLDVHRNVTAIVSLVRGLEAFDPAKVLLFTHRRLYHNPFGTSDMRAVYRDAGLLEDAYKLWYLALKMYGEPYLKGKVRNPAHRRQLEDALAALRAGGYLVTPDTDDVEILSLAAAVNFPAFEAKVRNLRENIFLAVRGSYLPFVEGVGGADAHGDTKVGKGNADAKEALLAKAIGRLYTRQLAPLLLAPNFGPDVVHQLPKVKLGGIDWEAVEKVTRAVGEIKEKFPGRVSISQSWLGPTLGIPPATGPDDEANVAPSGGGPDQPGGGGGGPGGGSLPSPSGIAGGATPPGSQADGPAARPGAGSSPMAVFSDRMPGTGADRTFGKGPPSPDLVPQSGDWDHPEHWVLPENAGGGATPAKPATPDATTGGQGGAPAAPTAGPAATSPAGGAAPAGGGGGPPVKGADSKPDFVAVAAEVKTLLPDQAERDRIAEKGAGRTSRDFSSAADKKFEKAIAVVTGWELSETANSAQDVAGRAVLASGQDCRVLADGKMIASTKQNYSLDGRAVHLKLKAAAKEPNTIFCLMAANYSPSAKPEERGMFIQFGVPSTLSLKGGEDADALRFRLLDGDEHVGLSDGRPEMAQELHERVFEQIRTLDVTKYETVVQNQAAERHEKDVEAAGESTVMSLKHGVPINTLAINTAKSFDIVPIECRQNIITEMQNRLPPGDARREVARNALAGLSKEDLQAVLAGLSAVTAGSPAAPEMS